MHGHGRPERGRPAVHDLPGASGGSGAHFPRRSDGRSSHEAARRGAGAGRRTGRRSPPGGTGNGPFPAPRGRSGGGRAEGRTRLPPASSQVGRYAYRASKHAA
ncbi:hypothetical protein CAG99_02940 [Streptomyces marincola]|uniref:Uncharacterized protein n=1 Tax=Streptomyces marincola TaxID=2878388 RepID=A0A1W7CT01_9ACTN|nr:hypothetical protein CAG99_02940 [Streptomyces marincola]